MAIWPILAGTSTRDEEEFVTELRNVPEGWFAVAGLAIVIAACWAVVWMYRREGRIGASERVRMALAIIRCAILVTLAVVFLEPVRVRVLRRWIDSYAIVLVDDSSSMDLTDRYLDPSSEGHLRTALGLDRVEPIRRTEVVHRMLSRDNRVFLRGLAGNNRVRLYTFSDEPQLLGTLRALRENRRQTVEAGGAQAVSGVNDVRLDLAATGAATNIERAVRRAIESLGRAPVAGIVVISDGGFNQGASADDVAGYARERRLPIHAVGIGDPSPPRNLRVTEVLAPENAFRQDPFAITARFAAQGMEGRRVRVRLRERDATGGGEGRAVDTRDVIVGPDGAIEPVVFERRQDRAGRYVYTVEVPADELESVVDDNSKQVTLTVIESRTRVLVVSAEPSWDYRLVTRLLQRDDTFNVSCWLQSADVSAVRDGNTVIDHLPRLAEELLEYDVVILMDPDGSELDEQWCRLLDTLVAEHGGGFLLTAARAHTPDLLREPRFKPLHDLLPVTLDPEADLVLNRIGHYQLSPSAVEIPPTAFGHPILQLADDVASTKLAWQGVGKVYWHYPVLREKPVATVLMRHGDPHMGNSYGRHVLAAVQFVGAGRAAFIGFDGTWRWRRYGEERFNRFWVQLVRYLAEGKLLGGAKRGMIVIDSDQFALGEAVTVSARLFDARYEPIQLDQVTAYFSVEGQLTEFVLRAGRDRPGWFEGRFVPDRTGSYRISLTIPDPAAREPAEISREILVSRPNIEILRPQMDRAQLVTLAEQSHGGRYFEIDEMTEITGLIPDLHEEIAIRSRPTTLWDNVMTLLLLIVLLTVEWAGRKWSRLL
jgi:hypothetical protein